MSKSEMLADMEARGWNHDTDEESSYSEVKEEYDYMVSELESAEDDMYPNGRDYDSEDWG